MPLTPDQRMFVNLYSQQYNQLSIQRTHLQEQIHRDTLMMNDLQISIQNIYDGSYQNHNQYTMASSYSTPASYYYATMTPGSATPISSLMTTETTPYIFSDIANPLNTECPISLEPFHPNSEVVQINRCGHLFNRDELSHWFQTSTRCPTCRTELSPLSTTNDTYAVPQLSALVYDLLFPNITDASNNYVLGQPRRNNGSSRLLDSLGLGGI